MDLEMDPPRSARRNVDATTVRWMMEPTQMAEVMWVPDANDGYVLEEEAALLRSRLAKHGVSEAKVALAGSSAAVFPALWVQGDPAPAAPRVAAGAHGGGASAGARRARGASDALAAGGGAGVAAAEVVDVERAPPNVDGGGLGFPEVGTQIDLASLQKELEDVKRRVNAGSSHSRDHEKKERRDAGRKKSKERKSSRSRKKKKKERDGASSTSDSRSSSGERREKSRKRKKRRSRSRSSSSSSGNERRGRRYLRWESKGKKRRVSPATEQRLSTVKFKQRGDLLTFAASFPGALAGFFLSMVHRRLSAGRISQSKMLRSVSVQTWAREHSGLTEVRDQREVLTLATVMDLIDGDQCEEAMDVLTQRICGIQKAKAKGGCLEKAGDLELVMAPNDPPVPGGMQRLLV